MRVIVARHTREARVQFSLFYAFLNGPDIGPNRKHYGDGDADDERNQGSHLLLFACSRGKTGDTATLLN
jgi:hypothetical protein